MQLADELGDGKEQFRCLRILMGKPMFGSGKMPSKDDEGKAFIWICTRAGRLHGQIRGTEVCRDGERSYER